MFQENAKSNLEPWRRSAISLSTETKCWISRAGSACVQGQMHAEAQAIRTVIGDLGYNNAVHVRSRYQRPIDERGRVISK